MRYLVDTHIFVWSILVSKKLSKKTKNLITNPENVKYVSIVSLWEISLKFSLGKIDLIEISPGKLPSIAKEAGYELLNLTVDEASSFFKLPKVENKDPFDRMLAWQAIKNDLTLLTEDKGFLGYHKYGLKITANK